MMRLCGSCGAEVADGDRFCKACGAEQDVPAGGGSPTAATQAPTGSETPLAGEAQASAAATAPPATLPVSVGWLGGQVVGLFGFLMLAIGPFMAWMSASFISVSGLQKTGNEALALVALGVVGALLALISILNKRSILAFIPVIAALLGLAMGVYYYIALLDDLSGLDIELFTPTLGAGIYICLFGAVLALIGSIVGAVKRKQGQPVDGQGGSQ